MGRGLGKFQKVTEEHRQWAGEGSGRSGQDLGGENDPEGVERTWLAGGRGRAEASRRSGQDTGQGRFEACEGRAPTQPAISARGSRASARPGPALRPPAGAQRPVPWGPGRPHPPGSSCCSGPSAPSLGANLLSLCWESVALERESVGLGFQRL